MIIDVLREELERLQRMEKSYCDKVAELPKGSIQFKCINGRKYPYLCVRECNRVKSQYLKLNEKELKELLFKIEQRRKYEKVLMDIKQDYRIILKAIHNE